MAATRKSRTAGEGEAGRWPPVTYWMKATVGVLAVLGMARLVLEVGSIIVLIIVSLILAIGFQPAVSWLVRRGLSRGWAVTVILLLGLAVLGAFLALVLPDVVRSVGELIRAGPQYLRQAQKGSGLLAELNARFDLSSRLQGLAGDLPGTLLGFVQSFGALVFNTLTILILTIYLTVAMPRIRGWFARLLADDQREDFEAIVEQSTQRVGGYVLGMFVVSLTAGLTTFVAMVLIGVPHAAALAFFVALADLIPTIGALLGAAVAVTVAAIGAGVPQAIGTAVFFLVYQQVENYVIHPRVMRRAIDMPAPVVIIAVLIGASLLGVLGALLAIPMAAVIRVAFRELYLEERLARVRRRSG